MKDAVGEQPSITTTGIKEVGVFVYLPYHLAPLLRYSCVFLSYFPSLFMLQGRAKQGILCWPYSRSKHIDLYLYKRHKRYHHRMFGRTSVAVRLYIRGIPAVVCWIDTFSFSITWYSYLDSANRPQPYEHNLTASRPQNTTTILPTNIKAIWMNNITLGPKNNHRIE